MPKITFDDVNGDPHDRTKGVDKKHKDKKKALYYYGVVVLAGLFLAKASLPPYTLDNTLSNLLIVLLFVEIAFYRYNEWKPAESEQYQLGAASTIDIVHKEGILYYNRNGSTYALFSNKVKTKAQPKDD